MRKILIRTVLGVVLVGGVLVAAPAHAQVQKWQNLSSGYCLYGLSSGNVHLYYCGSWSEFAGAYWTKGNAYGLSSPDNQYFSYLFSFFPNSQVPSPPPCLGVAAASKTHGASITTWTCSSSKDQYWKAVQDTSTGCYVFYNYNSGMVIGVSNGRTDMDAPVVQWEDLHTQAGHRDQLWCPITQ